MFFKRKKTDSTFFFNHTAMMEETDFQEKQDKVTIDLPNEERIRYWANILACTRADLLYAVINVGHSYKAVEAFLCMNQRQRTGTQ